LHSCIYDLVKVAFRDARGSGDWRVSEHADFYFQQRSIWLQRIINATKREKSFNSDKSFIDRILASRVMHPHKPVVNHGHGHGELSNRTERQPDMDRQGHTPNIMDTEKTKYLLKKVMLRKQKDQNGMALLYSTCAVDKVLFMLDGVHMHK
jgi:hypothetical protein